MMKRTELKNLNCNQTFFELMRRIEIMGERECTHESRNRIPKGVRLMQPAALHFSSSEISKISFDKTEILIEHRNFGMFAPYGPLPIHITEHAWVEKRFERNYAFEQFINMFSSHMAWLHYRAWSAMHPALCFERINRPFISRLHELVKIDSYLTTQYHTSVSACRMANLGIYLNTQRPLAGLQRILESHFRVRTSIYPRRGRWHKTQNLKHMPVRLGCWRLGQKVWDIQQTIDIEIGPIKAQEFQMWQRRSARINAVDAVVRDYTQSKIDFAIHVLVKTHPDFAVKVGAATLGVNTWLKPSHAITKLIVHEAF